MSDQNQNFTDLIDINAFFAELGLEGMSDEKKKEHLEKMNQILQGRILLRIADYISEGEDAQLEGKSAQEIIEFFDKKGVDVVAVATEEADMYKQEMISNISYAQGLIDQQMGEES